MGVQQVPSHHHSWVHISLSIVSVCVCVCGDFERIDAYNCTSHSSNIIALK